MPGKHSGQIFQKRHFDPDKFIKSGTGSISEVDAEIADRLERASEKSDYDRTKQNSSAATELTRSGMRAEKPRKIAMTYKHKEVNYEKLKWLSQKLKITMGDLIDEALEVKFAEWRRRVPPDPEF
jgi:hypothetical protein